MAYNATSQEVDGSWRKKLSEKIKNSGLSVDEFCRIEQRKCKANPFYFIDNYVYVKNRFNEEGDDLPKHLKDKIEGDKIRFVLYKPQRQLVQSYLDNNYTISNKTRQSGISTTAQAVALWILTFQNNKEVLVISKNLEAAKKFLSEMKFMHQNLPWFLRRKVRDDNKTTFSLGAPNNSSIMFSLTSGKSSGRSASATLLILDEAEFIQAIDDIWASAAPTLSATGGKAIVISTPWMSGSWFHNNILSAKEGTNQFSVVEVPWTSIPGRDKRWYKNQCKLLNNDVKKIKTELDMQWIIPGDQFYDEDELDLKHVMMPIRSPNQDINIYKEPEPDHLYIMGVDIYEGGEDSNSFVILDLMTKMDDPNCGIVCECVSKRLDTYELTIEWANYYNNAMVSIERNKGMSLIQDYINGQMEHRLVNRFDFKKKKFRDDEFGIFIDNTLRSNVLSLSVKWLSNKDNITNDLKYEMKTFVRKGHKYVGLLHDDLLFAFLYAIYYVNIIENYPLEVKNNYNLMKFLNSIIGEVDDVDKPEMPTAKIFRSLQNIIYPNAGFQNSDEYLMKSLGISDKESIQRIAGRVPI